MIFISLCTQKLIFFIATEYFSHQKRKKQPRSEERHAKQIRREKKQKKQLKTKHKIPNTKNVKYSEKDNNQREK